MSIFGSIMSKIFGDKLPAAGQASMIPGVGGGNPAPASGSGVTPAMTQGAPGAPAAGAPGAGSPASAAPSSMEPVDVAEVLDEIAEEGGQKLNWRVSIVDLMKLLELDSSLMSRKQLATELHYTGDMGDSAKMNVWLHKQVMIKLAENGGDVPAELLKHSS